ncbi:MAG: cytochrome-c peroxidase [Sphingomonadales bacterium]|nr:cytochrome-c peroxidase [Sphingomonadales bacterium]MDE2568656.1 cytochrome-c peroxidase [Sphingomonadales bacterium]
MRKLGLVSVAMAAIALASCGKGSEPGSGAGASGAAVAPASEDLMKTAREQFKAIPASYRDEPGNPATEAQIDLGNMLYHDPRLSGSHALACASCHNIGLGGGDDASTSIGHKWQQGGRNAPTVLNAVFNTAQFWDGRARDLTEQAGGPIANPIEMASLPEHVPQQLKSIPGYPPLFAKAFPGERDPVSFANAQKAIAAFETTLITPNSPFDKYLSGDAGALSAEQKDGLRLFIDKGCAACHNGINVGGGMYAKFGVAAAPASKFRPAGDKGREGVTHDVSDEYSFKVPTLRNIALTAPYFHTGSVWDLKEAVRVMGSAQLGQKLSDADVDKIAAFLGALTGEQPKVLVPILPPSGPDTSRPER